MTDLPTQSVKAVQVTFLSGLFIALFDTELSLLHPYSAKSTLAVGSILLGVGALIALGLFVIQFEGRVANLFQYYQSRTLQFLTHLASAFLALSYWLEAAAAYNLVAQRVAQFGDGLVIVAAFLMLILLVSLVTDRGTGWFENAE